MDTIKAYVRELCERGLFDEVDVGPSIGKSSQLKNFPKDYYPKRPVDTSAISRPDNLLKRPALGQRRKRFVRTYTNLNFEDAFPKNSLRNVPPTPRRNSSFEDLKYMSFPPSPIFFEGLGHTFFPPLPYPLEDYKC